MGALISVIISVLLMLTGCESTPKQAQSGELSVHFIDVGQGDCTLVMMPDGKNMLIDAGNKENSDDISDYLSANGVKKIDYAVATHPHADHIGSMADIISQFDVGKIYLPDAPHTSKIYDDMLNAISQKGIEAVQAKSGVCVQSGDGITIDLLAPVCDEYSELNNYSAVVKLTYGKTSFLFMGDAQKRSENEILSLGENVRADVLKCGHHGGATSSGEAFLRAANPKYAVISCGKGNSYGHPHAEVLTALKQVGADVLRTDLLGSIVITSDGDKVTVQNKYEPQNANAPPKDTDTDYVYITNSGKKYHRENCARLAKSKIKITRQDAQSRGLAPCKVCEP